MSLNQYHFITHWRFTSTEEEVYSILEDAEDLPRWWPAVYLKSAQLEKGAPGGVGKKVRLHTKGWLPYTLQWSFTCTEATRPKGFTLEAVGDFVGRGIWRFEQDGEQVNVTFDWKIAAQKPLLKILGPVLKPFFAANHHWAMKTGEESLRVEIARRRAKTQAERDALPPPPGPTFTRSK